MTQKNLQNRNRLNDSEIKLMATMKNCGGEDKLGSWNRHIHMTVYKINR